jgi:hypothetical protein
MIEIRALKDKTQRQEVELGVLKRTLGIVEREGDLERLENRAALNITQNTIAEQSRSKQL